VRQHPILAAPSTGSFQTSSSQRLREFDRDLEFIFRRKEAVVQEVTSGQEAVDDTPHADVDTATAVDTAAAAAAVSQQTGDTAPKKPKRSRLLRELECTLNMEGYWKSTGPRRSTRIALQF
jgi:anti-sigma factor ChrR (cupin superfamily)